MSGELPRGWVRLELGECCTVIMGQSPPGDTYNESGSGLPFFQGKAEFGELYPTVRKWCTAPGRLAEAGDILLSVRAPVGPTNLAREICCIGRGLASIRPEGGIDPSYVLSFIRSTAARLAEGATGTTFGAVNGDQVRAHEVVLAPLAEQQRIMEALDSAIARVDATVRLVKRVQRNLKRYRASVLKAAVEGRLVPTEAELARAEGSDYEPASKLLERILSERRERWGQSGRKGSPEAAALPIPSDLADLPEGWCWTTIGEAFEVVVGATPSRAEPQYWGGEIPWVSSGEVAFCRIHSTRETITQAGLAGCSTKLNPPGTVLMGMIGEGRTRGQAAILEVPACHNQNAAAIRVSEAGLPPEFTYYYLAATYERNRGRGSGNNQPALNKAHVQAIPMPMPPAAEQKRIAEALEGYLDEMERTERGLSAELRRLARLRQSILKWAFEGKLVDQDPNDEPASVLLDRIQAERAAAASTRKPRAKNPRAKVTR